ncbi:hypothetical protein VKT23_020365 [Stygiomarasmius scandens]|uniref:Uncharacterized protein n=1 Tax=Marasmiellus scandens TaxID=2682957 RepID=A0ABR1IKI0_9AGAR
MTKRKMTMLFSVNSQGKLLTENIHLVPKPTTSPDQVSDERLQQFYQDPANYGPKLRNSRLDKRGPTTSAILASHWNQALIHKLAAEADLIVSKCADDRFGHEPIEFKAMIHERLAGIIRTEIDARPRDDDETIEARILRLATHHQEARENSRKHNILHVKHHTRMSAATVMIADCLQQGIEDGVETWQYILKCLEKLSHHGMSDEEDAEEEAVIDGRQETVPVRRVLILPWRHESFQGLFDMLDDTRQVESAIFSQQGRPRIKRIRVDEVPSKVRTIPRHLPLSFFNPEYLAQIKYDHEVDNLAISKKPFPLRQITTLPNH